jgi:NhaP-type Na+/H+ or K+/H+ antiporter
MAQSLPREAEREAIAEREVILVVTHVVVVNSIVVQGLTIEPPPQRHLLPRVLQHLPAGLRALAAGPGTLLHVLVSGELLARRRAGVARPDARLARHVGQRALA